MRTVFNLLGPLANPARAQCQLIGAPSAKAAHMMAEALSELGTGHSYVVHGFATAHSGLDEISTVGPTHVFEVWTGKMSEHLWQPEDFGMERARLADLAGGGAAENAAIIQGILAGEPGPRRDIAVLNAAAALMACGKEATPRLAVEAAAASIDSGRAAGVLKLLQENFPA